MARENAGNLSKIKLDEKYKAASTNWLHDVPEHIKVRQRNERECRKTELKELQREPEPGYGLDGYPLQR